MRKKTEQYNLGGEILKYSQTKPNTLVVVREPRRGYGEMEEDKTIAKIKLPKPRAFIAYDPDFIFMEPKLRLLQTPAKAEAPLFANLLFLRLVFSK